MIDIQIDRLIRSRRRTITLMICPDGTLVVKSPTMTPLSYIKKLVAEKKSWIDKKRAEALKHHHSKKPKAFVNDEEFLYLGKKYQLKIVDEGEIHLMDYLYFPRKYLPQASEKIIEWYRKKALEKITQRVNWYSQLTGWKHKSISITRAERRWGSCGPTGSLNFSWRLIMAPLDVIDYVVVHELAHLVERNHSARFWDKVRSVLPECKEQRKWLREHGRMLVV